MRTIISIFTVTGALLTCFGLPAAAASKGGSWTPTYSRCEALALNRGIAINERRSSEYGPSPYRQFMVACLAGKVEGKPVVAPRIAAEHEIPGKWDSCDQLAAQRGLDVTERRGTEVRPSPWRQFMSACLAGRVH